METRIRSLWEQKPEYNCVELRHTIFNETAYRHEWFATEIHREHRLALREITQLRSEMQDLLGENHPQVDAHSRRKRIAPLAIAGIATGIFGAGMATGSSCFLKGIFGSCNKIGAENRKHIQETLRYVDDMEVRWKEVLTSQDEKFFLVASELREIRQMQKEVQETQNQNWEGLNATLNKMSENIHEYRTCQQILYTRGQLNHARMIMLSVLQQVYTNIKSYRTALYSYRINLLNSLGTMSNRLIPMSLVPKNDLQGILQALTSSPKIQANNLMLALNPITEVNAYYETRLLQEVYADEVGLIFKVSMPMATKASKLLVYRAIPIPMPESGTEGRAQIWKTGGSYLALTINGERHAVLSKQQLDDCVGSTTIAICHNGFSLNRNVDSCLYSLMQEDQMTALKDCETESYQLPATEQATNIGHGRWLLTSATGRFPLKEQLVTDHLRTIHEWGGCQSCIVSLQCGRQMQSKNIKIVADMETCANTNATITDIKLADPLEKLFGLLPSLDNMPHVPNVETARRELLQDIKFEIRKLPDGDRHSLERLPALAQPTVMRLSTVRPQMSSQIAEYTDWKRYLFFIFNALAVHILLHLLGKVYNHYIKRSKRMSHWLHRRPPFRTEHNGRKIKGKPVSVVSPDDYDYLCANPENPITRYTHVIPDTLSSATTVGPRPSAVVSDPSGSHTYATIPTRHDYPQLRSYLSTFKPLPPLQPLPTLPSLQVREISSNYQPIPPPHCSAASAPPKPDEE